MFPWCGCFSEKSRKEPQLSYQPGQDVDTDVFGQDISDEWKGTLVITLQKREGCSLGLTVSGGVDKAQRPHIANLRPGSIAYRCDSLMVGDLIISVNEIRTCGLRHEEIINLLKNAGINVSLEIEYKIPNAGPLSPNIQVKKCDVVLDKEPSGFGFTLRGGMLVESMRSHPLTVVAFRNGGPAHREGSIKVGDQILSVNGYNVTHLSLGETLGLLSQCESSACFTVAYETAIMDAVETASGPLDIEIDHSPGIDLGVTLTPASYDKKACMCVGYLQPMSLADRSGALHEGDHILSIDGAGVEAMSLAEAGQLLKGGAGNSIHLQVVPVTHLEHCAHREMLTNSCLSQSLSSHSGLHTNNKSAIVNNNNNNNSSNSSNYNTNSLSRSHLHHFNHNNNSSSSGSSGAGGGGGGGGSSSNGSSAFSSPHHHIHSFSDNSSVALSPFGTLNLRNKRNNWCQGEGRRATSCMSIASSSLSVLSHPNQVCHAETIEVILFADTRGMMGLNLKGGIVPSLPMAQPPTIGFVEPRSPADKCGVLQEGDRVLAVNGLETTDRTLDEVNRFLRDSRPRCVLLVEFDVTESVIPSSGTFIVKLLKRSGETGITVNSCSSNKTGQDSLLISDVRRGSVAHRSGSIQAGDKLLSINDVRLTRCTNDDAMHLLELPDDIVKLKLSRDDPDEGHEGFIIYTVELQRFGGPLGITISGTDDPHDPIIISELTPHGLAEKTGAIHIGDRLLAVSGDTTKNKPLSEAIRMLQSAGDVVTLKIARPDPLSGKDGLTVQPFDLDRSTPILSVDSAMESCHSSALDLGSPIQNGLDPGDITPTATTNCEFNVNGNRHSGDATALAVPQTKPYSEKYDQAFNTPQESHQITNGGFGSSSNYTTNAGGKNKDDDVDDSTNKDDDVDDSTNEDTDSNSTHIDDWVKTLEDLDLGSGSEMLRQIGLSLRQRSDHNLEPRSPSSSFSSKSKNRSKSTSRVANRRTSSSFDSIANSTPQSNSNSFQQNGHDDSPVPSRNPNQNNHDKISNRTVTESGKQSSTSTEDIYATPVKKKPPITPKPKFLKSSTNKSSSLPPGVSLPQSPTTPPALPPRKKDGVKDKPTTSSKTVFTPSPVQLQKVKLEKSEGAAEGFGFSLSDGLYERGVFISAINKDSPAHRAGLQEYDKLLQVDKVKVQDQDCHQVVPIIAQCGNKLTLIVCRNPLLRLSNSIKQEVAMGGVKEEPIKLDLTSSASPRGRERTRKGIFR